MLQIHKASAGSGKTFTLAREYIRLLLGRKDASGGFRLRSPKEYGFGQPKAHGAILAVTFTNKATEEMTQRIVKELYLLAHQDSPQAPKSAHAEYFTDLFGCSRQALAAASLRALADLLFNFSWFNVSTIDSFFQNIVRVFARDLDLPDNYTLEIDQRYPVMESVRTMLDSINLPRPSDPHEGRRRAFLFRSLSDYMKHLMSQGKAAHLMSQSSNLNRELVDTINNLINEDYKQRRTEMDAYFSDPERLQGFFDALSAQIEEAYCRMAEASRAVLSLQPEKNVQANLLKVLARLASGERPEKFTDAIMAVVGGDKSPYKGAWAKDPSKADPVVARALDEALAAMAAMPQVRLCSFVRSRFYPMVLFSYAATELEKYCRDNESFLLGDTNDLLTELIDEADAPFIYERTGALISHFLIDEFQDTSKMQWQNFAPLVRESLARGESDLIIGDEKQSIYRFRNADSELLGHRVEEEMAARFGDDAVGVRGVAIEENTNWRSAREIVLFNNTLFRAMAQIVDSLSQGDAVARAYRGLVQQVAAKNYESLPGYVEIVMHHTAKADKDAPAEDVPDSDRRTLGELTAAIESQLRRGYRPSDIAVLVRDHISGQKVIDCLLERMAQPDWVFGQIRIMSSDALEVGSSPTVMMIVNMLHLLSTPEMITDLRHFARSGETRMIPNPEFLRRRLIHRFQLCLYRKEERILPDGSVETVTLTPSEALARALDGMEDDRPDELQRQIDESLASLATQSCPNLYELVESIIQKTVPPEQAAADIAFVTAFQDQVLDFTECAQADMASFLRWFGRKGRTEKLAAPDGLDAITVTTIHQSKGLEYNCVHLPFFSRALVRTAATGTSWYDVPPGSFPGIDPALVPPMLPLENLSTLAAYPPFAPAYDRYCEEQRLDSLNVAYVAFTRPVRELNVYATAKDDEKSVSLGTVLRRALEEATDQWLADEGNASGEMRRWMRPLAPGVTVEPEAGGECLRFTMGRPTAPVASGGKETGPWADLPELPLPPGVLAGYNVYTRKEIAISDSLDEIQRYSISDERRYGLFLHDVLGGVARIADLPQAMRRAAYRARLTPEEERHQLRLLEKALDDPRVRPWFEGYTRVVTERPSTTPAGVRPPDRIVWLPSGEVCVIDYKFGAEKKSYYRQVGCYMQLLADMGHTKVSGYIWYPLQGVIRSVKP